MGKRSLCEGIGDQMRGHWGSNGGQLSVKNHGLGRARLFVESHTGLIHGPYNGGQQPGL